MDILIDVVLPVSLAIIMLSLGIGLTVSDFKRVAERKLVFFVGSVCQILLLPIIAYVIVLSFGLTGPMAVGVMLLSFCPGGITSNVVSRLANGDVALSVSLTAVVSLLSIVTVPLLVGWAVEHFLEEQPAGFSVASLALTMVLITALPVGLGMLIRALAPGFADRYEPKLLNLASVLFAIIVLAAIAANWTLLTDNIVTLGPALAALNLVMMTAGLLIAGALGFTWGERKTISIEVGLQNGTLAIALAPLITGVSGGITAVGLPAAVYGVIMYVTALPFVLWLRMRAAKA